jgi:pimeloyl-ACP methyl ester carboxylesterase
MKLPETRYARNNDVHIAYQVVGEGPLDLLFATSYVSHLEFAWGNERIRHFYQELADFSRLILFDKRGTGMSDPLAAEITLEDRVADIRAVLDAVGSERTALFGTSEGATLAAMFAATWPERSEALVVFSPFVTGHADAECPWAWSEPQWTVFLDMFHDENVWRSEELMAEAIRSNDVAGFAEETDWYVRYWRASASPAVVRRLMTANKEIDIRPVLPTITVPTLVLQRRDEEFLSIEYGRYVARKIPGARMVELEGRTHYPWLENADEVLDHMREFLTGTRERPSTNRVLSTVLFTDIVASTARATEEGDRNWRAMLDQHDTLCARQVERFRGRLIKTTGDGILATFDGPARAVQCARAIVEVVRRLNLEARAGVHTGEIELRGDDIAGIALSVARRICDAAEASRILTSRTVKDLVFGSGLEFQERGIHELRGVPGTWDLFEVA